MSMFSSITDRLAGRAGVDGDAGAAAASHHSGESDQDAGETRSELLFRIQELTERNERLTLRFRDVVGAYKATLKEKEALESSIAAWGGGGGEPSEQHGADAQPPTEGDDSASGSENQTPSEGAVSKEGSGGTGDANVAKLRQQLDALGRSMATLTKEKKEMETRFQADKKVVADAHRIEVEQLRTDFSARVERLETLLAEVTAERDAKAETVDTLNEQLRAGHEADRARIKEWEKARKQHMKELEDARKQRESSGGASARVLELETLLQKAQDAELEALTQLSTGTAELKEKIHALEEELDAANKQLLATNTKGDGEQVLKLKNELAIIRAQSAEWQRQAELAKAELADAVKTAQMQITSAAAKVSLVMSSSDEQTKETLQQRILQENRLAELSAMVGRYEAARLEDSARIADLQSECDELRTLLRDAETGARDNIQPAMAQSVADVRVKALEETVEKLQDLLRKSNQQLAESEAMHHGDDTRANGVDDASGARTGGADELRRLRQTERELRAQLSAVIREKETELLAVTDRWEAKLVAEQMREHTALEALEAEHRRALEEVVAKQARTRERTLQLIDDRNKEISRLRKLLGAAAPQESGAPGGLSEEDGAGTSDDGGGGGFVMVSGGRADAGALVHDVLERSERDKELVTMRREMRELEGAVLDANERASLLEEQSKRLKEEIRRLERNKKREGANLEYLKNVLVKFMTKEIGQEQMLLAIATILQFSPAELSDVKRKINAQQARTWSASLPWVSPKS